MSTSIVSKIPNFLTYGRIASTVLMLIVYLFQEKFKYETLFLIFTVSAITDFFDGYISRKWGATSRLGKCLDPISDKILIITSLFIAVDAKIMHVAVAFVLASREVIVSGLREFLAFDKIELPVTRLAKWKTAFQLLAVGSVFFSSSLCFINWYLGVFGDVLVMAPVNFIIENHAGFSLFFIIMAVVTTVLTGLIYLKNSAKYL